MDERIGMKFDRVTTTLKGCVATSRAFHHVDPRDGGSNSLKMYQLTSSQIDQFHRDGFLVVKAEDHMLVDPEALKQWTEEVKAWPKVFGKWMPYEEVTTSCKRQLMRTEKFVDYHDGFQGLLCGDTLRNTLAQLSDDVSPTI